MLNAKLIIVGGDAKSGEVKLRLPMVVGRGKEANLTVPHALVSRRHTEIFERNGKLHVRDLGSLNGTFVNNTRIKGDQVLEPNQLLTLGNITFRAVYEPQFSASSVDSNETILLDTTQTETTETAAVEMDTDPSSTSPTPRAKSALSDLVEFDADGSIDSLIDAPQDSPVEPIRDDAPASDLFSIETGEDSFKPVSASAVDQLPSSQAPVSFIGKLDVGQPSPTLPSSMDSVKIDLGDDNSPPKPVEDSQLGSFLNQLPR